jgi:hypothetical protein
MLCFCLFIGSTQNKQEVQTGQKSVISLESSSLKLLSQLVPNLVGMFIEWFSKIIMFFDDRKYTKETSADDQDERQVVGIPPHTPLGQGS